MGSGGGRTTAARARASTLHDVAALVGVSPKTVSRVVRNEGGCSDDTKQRILAAIDELDYRPNAQARGLISGRSATIAFIAPVLSDPFFPELADGVQVAARNEGLTVLLAMSEGDADRQSEVLASLEAHRPDGVVIFPIGGDADLLVPFLERGVPMVLIDSVIDHPNAISVCSDLAGGTQMAVERLVERGCERLVMLGSMTDMQTEPRHTTFLDSAPGTTQPFIANTDITMDGGRATMSRLLDEHPDVDGVFCYNDVLAIGALQALQAAGKSVPDDVAVIGFDDINMGAVVSPSLTTVRIDRERVGAEAVRQIVALTNGTATGDSVLDLELIVRESA